METVNILWTGGLDSTYRVLELSRLPVIIKPYYIWDKTRGSIKQELNAMKKISHDIAVNPATKAKLLPVNVVMDSDIKDDPEITNAWKVLNDKYALGSQYDYLARFAKQNGLKLEVGIECSERSKASNTIKKETSIHIHNSLRGGYSAYFVDPSKSSYEGGLVFKDLLLPATLWNMSKLDEIEKYKEWGYKKTIKKTWFCHRPVFGMPCGHCNPCKDCLNEGLAFRVPRLGYILGGLRGKWQAVKYHIKKYCSIR